MSGKLLTRAQREALSAYAHAADHACIYWGSPKTSATLSALGLVEKYLPPSVAQRPRMKARPYRITPAGRSALQQGAPDHG